LLSLRVPWRLSASSRASRIDVRRKRVAIPFDAGLASNSPCRFVATRACSSADSSIARICGGQEIACRESLSDLTGGVAMTWCQDKMLTSRRLASVGLPVPRRRTATSTGRARSAWAGRGC
jgi:hypothetical protein